MTSILPLDPRVANAVLPHQQARAPMISLAAVTATDHLAPMAVAVAVTAVATVAVTVVVVAEVVEVVPTIPCALVIGTVLSAMITTTPPDQCAENVVRPRQSPL